MTIVVAYVPRAEGMAAVEKGIQIAKRENERLIVVNASEGGNKEDAAVATVQDADALNRMFELSGVDAQYKQFVRGKTAIEEIEGLIEADRVSLVVIGLRRRSLVGKLLLGSTAQEILMHVSCPVLCVKPNP